MDNTELILKYFNHQLDDKELDDFLRKVETDEDFKEDVDDYKRLLDGFRTHKIESFQAKLKKWSLEEIPSSAAAHQSDDHSPNNSSSNNHSSSFISKKTFAPLAAMLGVVMLGVFYFLIHQNNSSSFIQELIGKVELNENVLKIKENRSEKNTGNDSDQVQQTEISKAKELYKNAHTYFEKKEYKQAAKGFRIIYDNEEYSNTVGRKESGWLFTFSEYLAYEKNKTDENKLDATHAIQHFLDTAYEEEYQEEIVNTKKLRELITEG